MEVNAKALLTDEIKGLMAAYLAAKVYAEAMRARANEIQSAILADSVELRNMEDGERITDPSFAWMSDDDAKWSEYYAEYNLRSRACGIKPADMPDNHCPASVAEIKLIEATDALVDAIGKALNIDDLGHILLCHPNCLEQRREFLDFIASLIFAAERDGITA